MTRTKALVSTSALALFLASAHAVIADADIDGYIEYPIGTDPDTDWIIDRADVSEFINVGTYGGRSDVIVLSIDPSTAQPSSFYNWQGYLQTTTVPSGNSFIGGDLWIADGWQTGTDDDFVNTGMWGSAMPEDLVAGQQYVNEAAVFPIIHFTNQGGIGRLTVWDNTANPTGGWIDLPETADLIGYGEWNSFQMRLLPDAAKIEYLLNGNVFYTWDMPGPEDPTLGVVDQFFAMYLKARNNGVTSFSSYWSRLMSGLLISGGEQVTDTPYDVLVSPEDEAARTVVIADGANIGGSIVADGLDQGAVVTFTGGTSVANDLIGSNTAFVFSTSGLASTAIGGDVEISDASSTTGGTVGNPIAVAGNVTVDDTSTFGGNWSIAGNLQAGGTISPGNSIGTVTVTGNQTFGPASVYVAEIDAEGNSDLTSVGGVATLDGTVEAVPLNGGSDFILGAPYTILTAQGGFAGTTFDGVTWSYSSAFLSPVLSYSSNNVQLTIERNETSFASAATTANQAAAAGALDTLGFGNAAYDEIALSAVALPDAFDQLSGEIHATARNALIEDSRLARGIVSDRLRSGSGSSSVVWTQAIGSSATMFSDGNAGEADRDIGGFMAGADGTLDNGWTFGFAGGYAHTKLDVDSRLSSALVDSVSVAAYGGGKVGDFTLSFGGVHSWQSIDTSRSFAMSGGTQRLTADYNGRTAQIFGEIGYEASIGGANLEPFLAAAYVNQHQSGFVERGGDAALSGQSSDAGLGFSTIGLRASTTVPLAGGTLRLSGTAGWVHAFGDVSPATSAAFDGGSAFSVTGTPLARDAALLDAGVDLLLAQRVTLGAAYTGKFSSEASSHDLSAKLTIRF